MKVVTSRARRKHLPPRPPAWLQTSPETVRCTSNYCPHDRFDILQHDRATLWKHWERGRLSAEEYNRYADAIAWLTADCFAPRHARRRAA